MPSCSDTDIARALAQFGQIDSSLSRKYEGAGIGLPLSRKLLELHGGALHLRSTLGSGTVVDAIFPAMRVSLVADVRMVS